jgi:hypothetical protein
MKNKTKQAFQKHLQRRFSLRLHMFIILLVTILSGVLFSKILLMFNVVNFAIRYPLAVVFSYLVFFACIKLWLICISPSKPGVLRSDQSLPAPAPKYLSWHSSQSADTAYSNRADTFVNAQTSRLQARHVPVLFATR